MLTAETRTREAAEPSGEPETLWGRMRGKMGDRVQFNKPEGLSEKKAKQKKKYAHHANSEVHKYPYSSPLSNCTYWNLGTIC